MSDFIHIEQMFSTWPTARADIEPLVPDRPTFAVSRNKPSMIEVDDAWAIMMLAYAPNEESFNILARRIEWLATVNAVAMQACRLDQFKGLPLTADTMARINYGIYRQDEWRKSVRLPSFKDLARDALGLQSILRPFEVVMQVNTNATFH